MYTIYVHTCRVDGKKYVGITCSTVKRRWQGHCAAARRGSMKPFHVAIREHGTDAWEAGVLGSSDTKSTANSLEREWIVTLRTIEREHGYNATHGGDGCKADDATRAKMRAAKLGTCLPESTKQKIGLAQRGIPKGPLTPEHRAKLSEIAQHRIKEPRSKAVLRISPDGCVERYSTLAEAFASIVGLEKVSTLANPSGSARFIRACCNGERETMYGYVWRWA